MIQHPSRISRCNGLTSLYLIKIFMYVNIYVEVETAIPTRIMLVGTAIAVSTGRIADPTRTILPYLGRNCDSVKAVIVLIF